MKIMTPHGYVYKIKLVTEPEITEITSDNWEDLLHHYDVCYEGGIYIRVDDEGDEFLRCLVYDERGSAKRIVNEPEMQVIYLKYPLAIDRK